MKVMIYAPNRFGAVERPMAAPQDAFERGTRMADGGGTHKFYCVKCKASVEVPEADTRVETSDKGRRMRKGKCPACSTNVTRILGKNDA